VELGCLATRGRQQQRASAHSAQCPKVCIAWLSPSREVKKSGKGRRGGWAEEGLGKAEMQTLPSRRPTPREPGLCGLADYQADTVDGMRLPHLALRHISSGGPECAVAPAG
jgi:hypothetical protein